MTVLQVEVQELQKKIRDREIVYDKLMREQRMEKEIGERIQQQFRLKQLELEYVHLFLQCVIKTK